MYSLSHRSSVVEQRFRKPQVNGSNPFGGSTHLSGSRLLNASCTKRPRINRGPFAAYSAAYYPVLGVIRPQGQR